MAYSKIEDLIVKIEDYYLESNNDSYRNATYMIAINLERDHQTLFSSIGVVELTTSIILASAAMIEEIDPKDLIHLSDLSTDLQDYFGITIKTSETVCQKIFLSLDLKNKKEAYMNKIENQLSESFSHPFIDDENELEVDMVGLVEYTFRTNIDLWEKDYIKKFEKLIETTERGIPVTTSLGETPITIYSIQSLNEEISIRIKGYEPILDELQNNLEDNSFFNIYSYKVLYPGHNPMMPNVYYIEDYIMDLNLEGDNVTGQAIVFDFYHYENERALNSCDNLLKEYPLCLEAHLCKIGLLFDPLMRIAELQRIVEMPQKEAHIKTLLSKGNSSSNLYLRAYLRAKFKLGIEQFEYKDKLLGIQTMKDVLIQEPNDYLEVRGVLLEKYLMLSDWANIDKMLSTNREDEYLIIFYYAKFIHLYFTIGESNITEKACKEAIIANPLPFAILVGVDIEDPEFPMYEEDIKEGMTALESLMYFCEKDPEFLDYVFKIFFDSGVLNDFIEEDPIDELINKINLN